MNWIVLPLALLFIALPYQARGEPARVGGSVDCNSTHWCSPKDLEIIGGIDSSTFEKFKRLIDNVHDRAVREKKGAHLALELVTLNSPGGSVTAATGARRRG
jgi:hypothetical protein